MDTEVLWAMALLAVYAPFWILLALLALIVACIDWIFGRLFKEGGA